MLLRGDRAGEVVAMGEEGVGPELEGEGGRGACEEEVGALQVGFRVGEVVGVSEQEVGEAKAGADLGQREEGQGGLEEGLQALDGDKGVPVGELRLVRQCP